MYKSFYYKLINFSLFFVFCFSFLNIGDAKALGFFNSLFQSIIGNGNTASQENTVQLSTVLSKISEIWFSKNESTTNQNTTFDLNSSSLKRVKNSSICLSGDFSDQVECDRLKEQAQKNDAQKEELGMLKKLQIGANNTPFGSSQSGGGSSAPSSGGSGSSNDQLTANQNIPTTQQEFNNMPAPAGADRATSLINNDNDGMGVPKLGSQALSAPNTLQGNDKGYSDFNSNEISPKCSWPQAVNNTGSCGRRTDVTQRLQQDLQIACTRIGKPIPVKSLKRDPECNSSLKGAAKKSEHLDGTGFDFGWYELSQQDARTVAGFFKLRGYRHGCYGTGKGNHIHFGFREKNNYYIGPCPDILVDSQKTPTS